MFVVENDAEAFTKKDHQLQKAERIDDASLEKRRVGRKRCIGRETVRKIGVNGISNLYFARFCCKHVHSPISPYIFHGSRPGTPFICKGQVSVRTTPAPLKYLGWQ